MRKMSDKEIQSDKKMISENDLLSETKAEMDTISKQILELQEKSELTKSEKRRLSRLQKKVELLEAQQEEEKEQYLNFDKNFCIPDELDQETMNEMYE